MADVHFSRGEGYHVGAVNTHCSKHYVTNANYRKRKGNHSTFGRMCQIRLKTNLFRHINKGKGKIVCMPKQHDMMVFGGVEAKLPVFLTSALDD